MTHPVQWKTDLNTTTKVLSECGPLWYPEVVLCDSIQSLIDSLQPKVTPQIIAGGGRTEVYHHDQAWSDEQR